MTSRFPQLRIHHFSPPHQIARSQPQIHQAPPYETREGAKNTIPEPRTSQSSVPRHHGLIIRPQSPPGDGLREGPSPISNLGSCLDRFTCIKARGLEEDLGLKWTTRTWHQGRSTSTDGRGILIQGISIKNGFRGGVPGSWAMSFAV